MKSNLARVVVAYFVVVVVVVTALISTYFLLRKLIVGRNCKDTVKARKSSVLMERSSFLIMAYRYGSNPAKLLLV